MLQFTHAPKRTAACEWERPAAKSAAPIKLGLLDLPAEVLTKILGMVPLWERRGVVEGEVFQLNTTCKLFCAILDDFVECLWIMNTSAYLSLAAACAKIVRCARRLRVLTLYRVFPATKTATMQLCAAINECPNLHELRWTPGAATLSALMRPRALPRVQRFCVMPYFAGERPMLSSPTGTYQQVVVDGWPMMSQMCAPIRHRVHRNVSRDQAIVALPAGSRERSVVGTRFHLFDVDAILPMQTVVYALTRPPNFDYRVAAFLMFGDVDTWLWCLPGFAMALEARHAFGPRDGIFMRMCPDMQDMCLRYVRHLAVSVDRACLAQLHRVHVAPGHELTMWLPFELIAEARPLLQSRIVVAPLWYFPDGYPGRRAQF